MSKRVRVIDEEKVKNFFKDSSKPFRKDFFVSLNQLHELFSEMNEGLEQAIAKNEKIKNEIAIPFFTGQRALCNRFLFGIERKLLEGERNGNAEY